MAQMEQKEISERSLTIRLPESLLVELERLARAEDRTISALVRRLLRDAIAGAISGDPRGQGRGRHSTAR